MFLATLLVPYTAKHCLNCPSFNWLGYFPLMDEVDSGFATPPPLPNELFGFWNSKSEFECGVDAMGTHSGEKLFYCTQCISSFATRAHLKQHMSAHYTLRLSITIMDAQKHSRRHSHPATNLLGLCFTMIRIVINMLAIVTTMITLCNQVRQPCTVADYYDHNYDHWWDWTTISTNNYDHNHDHTL